MEIRDLELKKGSKKKLKITAGKSKGKSKGSKKATPKRSY